MSIMQVEYVQSTGAQYIDTGFVPNNNTSVEMRIAFTDISVNQNLFCARGVTTQTDTYTCFLITGSGIRFDYYDSTVGQTGYIPSVGSIINVKAVKNKVYINDVLKYTYSERSYTADGNMWLLASYVRSGSSYGTVQNYAKAKLYYCKIYDNGTLIRNYVPARDTETGKIGLYDLLSKTLYTSKQDTLQAGPDVQLINTNKYLIQNGTSLYTIVDGDLVELESTEITADLFRTYGAEDPPTSEILLTLINPKVLAWNDEEQTEFTATVTATPYPQTSYSPEYDMTDSTILGIETVIVEASDDVTFAVSFDSGETWKYYTGTEWATLSEETSGMSAEAIMAIPTDKWAEVATTGTFKIRATLPSVESTLSSFVVDYLNA